MRVGFKIYINIQTEMKDRNEKTILRATSNSNQIQCQTQFQAQIQIQVQYQFQFQNQIHVGDFE